jgi:hypothetical protein
MLANTMNADATEPLMALLAISIQELGPNHCDTLKDRANLVVALVDLGRYREAIAILHTALPAMTSVLGASHPVTVHARENLGHCYEMICARPDCTRPRSETKCARCLVTGYCSSACKKADWKRHKLACTLAVTPNLPRKKNLENLQGSV